MELKVKLPLWMDAILALIVLLGAVYAVSQGLSLM
jgi:hypothetical protein